MNVADELHSLGLAFAATDILEDKQYFRIAGESWEAPAGYIKTFQVKLQNGLRTLVARELDVRANALKREF